jgi:hypothetical protein
MKIPTIDELCTTYSSTYEDAKVTGVVDPLPCAVDAVTAPLLAEIARLERQAQIDAERVVEMLEANYATRDQIALLEADLARERDLRKDREAWLDQAHGRIVELENQLSETAVTAHDNRKQRDAARAGLAREREAHEETRRALQREVNNGAAHAREAVDLSDALEAARAEVERLKAELVRVSNELGLAAPAHAGANVEAGPATARRDSFESVRDGRTGEILYRAAEPAAEGRPCPLHPATAAAWLDKNAARGEPTLGEETMAWCVLEIQRLDAEVRRLGGGGK